MLQKELAEALDISPTMVSKLVKRGMPTDTVERAVRWRKRHLEPGRVKAYKPAAAAPTMASPKPAPAPPHPPRVSPPPTLGQVCYGWRGNWLEVVAPTSVSTDVAEAAAIMCHGLLKRGLPPSETAYPVAFLRDLLRRLPPGEWPRMPLGLWLHLVDYALNEGAAVRKSADTNTLLTAEGFGQCIDPTYPVPYEWAEAAADPDGVSVVGWPDGWDSLPD